jgi:hypothetical protein
MTSMGRPFALLQNPFQGKLITRIKTWAWQKASERFTVSQGPSFFKVGNDLANHSSEPMDQPLVF